MHTQAILSLYEEYTDQYLVEFGKKEKSNAISLGA